MGNRRRAGQSAPLPPGCPPSALDCPIVRFRQSAKLGVVKTRLRIAQPRTYGSLIGMEYNGRMTYTAAVHTSTKR